MLVFYLSKKCQVAMEDNKSYWLGLYNDPTSIINFKASSALIDSASDGVSGLKAFAGDYIANNADALAYEALKAVAPGAVETLEAALQLANNLLAAAVMANNNLVLKMLQELAWSIMQSIALKEKKLYEAVEHVKELYILLASLVATVPEWDTYWAKLREAVQLIESARVDVVTVANTYASRNIWLDKKFSGTVAYLEQAKELINPKGNSPAVSKISEGSYKIQQGLKTGSPDKTQPKENAAAQTAAKTKLVSNGASKMAQGLAFFGAGLSDQFPSPSTNEQWQAMVAIPKVTELILNTTKDYFVNTARLNLQISAFIMGLGDLSSGIGSIFRTYVLSLLNLNTSRLKGLSDEMSLNINGSIDAKSAPIPSDPKAPTRSGYFTPNSLTVTTLSFKWIMDINLILSGYKLIPTKQLTALSLSQEAVNYYYSIVAQLQSMGDRRSGLAKMSMTEAQEETGDLETQVLALLVEANAAAFSGGINRGILSLCRTVLSRFELTFVADQEIYVMMEKFYNYPLPDASTLQNTFDGVKDTYVKAGLERAANCLATGDYKKLFGLTGKAGSYVGAALTAAALLKKCLGKNWSIDEWMLNLRADMDILNIQFSINFRWEIILNLLYCLNIKVAIGDLDPLEIACAIARDIVANKGNVTATWDKMTAFFSKSKNEFIKVEKE